MELYYPKMFIAFFQIIKRLRGVGVEIVEKDNILNNALLLYLFTRYT
jgi:hypothetical protein